MFYDPFDHIGLSPRVWGNRGSAILLAAERGSIPTCVGKPGGSHQARGKPQVYPHVCGETYDAHTKWSIPAGLSPRVWGNLGASTSHIRKIRSIPTCVGKPSYSLAILSIIGVYPHVCGETRFCCGHGNSPMGLSPRVWGNLHYVELCENKARSIPTCVGKPW